MKTIIVALLLSVSAAVAQDRCTFTTPTEAKVTKTHIQAYTQTTNKAAMVYVFEATNCTVSASKGIYYNGDEKFDINLNDVLVIKKFKNGRFDAYRQDGKKHHQMDVISAD